LLGGEPAQFGDFGLELLDEGVVGLGFRVGLHAGSGRPAGVRGAPEVPVWANEGNPKRARLTAVRLGNYHARPMAKYETIRADAEGAEKNAEKTVWHSLSAVFSVSPRFVLWIQSRLGPLAASVWVVTAIVGVIAGSWALARYRMTVVNFCPMNGDFQTFNPIRRALAGEVVGRDFDVYLGLGPNALVGAATAAAGGDFAASLFASTLLHALAAFTAPLILARLAGLSWSIAAAFGLAAAAAVPDWSLFHPDPGEAITGWLPYWRRVLSSLGEPCNSMIGLRCFGVIAAAPAVAALSKRLPGRRTVAGLGVVGGLLAVWSNDYGLAALASLTAVIGLVGLGQIGLWATLQTLALMLIVSGCVALAAVSVATAAHPFAWFDYNFRNVARDQFWYFLPADSKIVSLTEIPHGRGVLIGVGTAVILAGAVVRTANPAAASLLFVVLANLLAAELSAVGGWPDDRYFFPLYRTLLIAGPLAAVLALWPALRPLLRGPLRWRACWLAAVTLAVVVASVAYTRGAFRRCRALCRSHLANGHYTAAPELGGRIDVVYSKMLAMGRFLRDDMDAARRPPRERIHSTYTSALDVVAGAAPSVRSDYMIHAIGPGRRAEYLADFCRVAPPVVTTIRPEFSTFEFWLRHVNWDFYRELIRHYDPVDRTFYNIVWRRRAEPRALPPLKAECVVRSITHAVVEIDVTLPTGSADTGPYLVEVEVEYATAWRAGRPALALRQYLYGTDLAQPGFGVHWGMPLGRSTFRFPVEVAPGGVATATLRLKPEADSQLMVQRTKAQPIIARKAVDGIALRQWIAMDLTAGPYVRGVSTGPDAEFLVSDPTDLRDLRAGDRLVFAGSGERRIREINANRVILHGPVLKPAIDGFPNHIQATSHP